jgi:hypothetical protein
MSKTNRKEVDWQTAFEECGRGELFEPWDMPTVRRRKRKAPDLARALKQAKRAGESVTGATVTADGVTLNFGSSRETGSEQTSEFDSWMAKHHAN